jgi:uncharacterized phage infection (PIP) family protein YhgE
MIRFQEMQNHINRLRQDLNAISATAQQLQQAEQQAQSQLARLSQHESLNSQQLQRISQICNSLQSDVIALSSAMQQISTAVPAFTAGQFGVGVGTGQLGAAGYTAGVAPYTGLSTTAGIAPYTGFTTTAQNVPFYGSAAGTPFTNVPNLNLNLPVTHTASPVYGGAYAYRPWPDKDNPAVNIGTSFVGSTF